MSIDLYLGDCLSIMTDLPDQSVDMVLCDLPYGTTACPWDAIIPYDDLWGAYKRIVKKRGAIVLFGAQPFTSMLIASQPKMFRHSWVWKKNFATNFYHAKRMPLRRTEDIIVFGSQSPNYYPQITEGHVPTQSARGKSSGSLYHGENIRDDPGGKTTRYPLDVLEEEAVDQKNRYHPTEKPVPLLSYLIRTYSNPGEVVLDNTMGSGSTGVACVREGRAFCGIEKDPTYFEIANQRIHSAVNGYDEPAKPKKVKKD